MAHCNTSPSSTPIAGLTVPLLIYCANFKWPHAHNIRKSCLTYFHGGLWSWLPHVLQGAEKASEVDLDLWVAASMSWGIGLCVKCSWAACVFLMIVSSIWDIGWAESIAIDWWCWADPKRLAKSFLKIIVKILCKSLFWKAAHGTLLIMNPSAESPPASCF